MKIKIQVVSLRLEKVGDMLSKYDKINSPVIAVGILREYIGFKDREYIAMLCLDNKNKINSISTESIGMLNASISSPREIFKTAILSNSSSIIIAHNHPSGDVTPSKDDILFTKRIKEAGKILGIELLDHIIVSPNREYTSLKERGDM